MLVGQYLGEALHPRLDVVQHVDGVDLRDILPDTGDIDLVAIGHYFRAIIMEDPVILTLDTHLSRSSNILSSPPLRVSPETKVNFRYHPNLLLTEIIAYQSFQ